MTTTRTFARSAAVIGAATALTVAGAGAAMAATAHTHDVDGNDVSVTFDWTSDGILDRADACGAVITQVSEAVSVAAQFAEATSENDLVGVLNTFRNNDSVKILAKDGILIDRPVVVLGDLNPSDSVSIKDLPSNVYALISVCTDDPTSPVVTPFVMVGNPVEAVMGSVQSASSGDSLGAASSLLQSGNDTEGNLSASLLGGGTGSDAGE